MSVELTWIDIYNDKEVTTRETENALVLTAWLEHRKNNSLTTVQQVGAFFLSIIQYS